VALLALDRVYKSFGAVKVADDLAWTLDEGEALGIIGPNGAGKSSAFDLIGGNLRPDSGRILFDGSDITGAAPFRRCRAGIGRTYQIPRPFSAMTVFENLLVSASFGCVRAEAQTYDHCAAVLESTGLLGRANLAAGSLALLDRKRLELARALASSPRLLLLDEIAGGLTEREAQELVELVRRIHRSGTAIIWIEHVVHALLAVVSRLIVMNFGAKVMEGEPAAVMGSAEVRRIYMGIAVE
jgi:branched-chain amino acid transport system ATP-binding protein